MLNYIFKTLILNVSFLLIVLLTNAQTEYLVTVNPADAAISKIDSISGVTWLIGFSLPSYCEYDHSYTFIGGNNPTGNPFYLFTVDAITGHTISRPLFPDHPLFSCLQYSRYTNHLYGSIRTVGSNHYSLALINRVTGAYSIFSDFPGLLSIIKIIADDANNRFFIFGVTGAGGRTLLTVDMTNGNIISQVYLSSVLDLAYDHLTDKIYAISVANPQPPQTHQIFTFCNVDPGSGAVSNINDISNLAVLNSGYETLDENGGRYFFIASEWSDTSTYLYSVNINNGNTITRAAVPENGAINYDNLIEFRYDNNLNKLYALFWEAHTLYPTSPIGDSSCRLNIQTKIYPNPSGDILTINKNKTVCTVRINIFNMLGQLVIKNMQIVDGLNHIQISQLSSGAYYYQFSAEGKILLSGEFIKQ